MGGDAEGAGRRGDAKRGGGGKRRWEQARVKERERLEIMEERKRRCREETDRSMNNPSANTEGKESTWILDRRS